MNKVELLGRPTGEPDVRYSNGENRTAIANMTLAVNRKGRHEEGEQTADFPRITAFGKTAEFIEKYVHKGKQIAVVGHIQTGSYTNKDGVKVYTTDVIAEEVFFADSKDSSAAPGTVTIQTDDGGFLNVEQDEEDLPFGRI